MKTPTLRILFLSVFALATGCVSETLRLQKAGPKVNAGAELLAKSGSKVSGRAELSQEGGQLTLSLELKGLPRNSLHGFHVHEKGDCSASDASSAGGHFNPHGQSHGGPTGGSRHLGDLGNLLSDGTGRVQKILVLEGAALDGGASLLGKSLVVHEKADDLRSQPAGNSGARIACGVIQLKSSN